ncbi:MAG: riboflavin biosynthesis protein RibF [Clostridia bacterium]|nr:riboflavin biosynthesis protein RibF [Clostridia bacterium]
MITITDLATRASPAAAAPYIAALGDFDGVHLGHRAVLDATREGAWSRGIKSAAWFFNESPKDAAAQLFDTEQKEREIASLNIDYTVREDFSAVCDLTPEEFVGEYLPSIGCRGVVCGFNFRFGRGASGDADMLSALCLEHGLYFASVPPVTVRGNVVSSSAIRSRLSEGDAEGAAEMLGRPYSVLSAVEHGRAVGRSFGFPTVNQNFAPRRVIPRCGVYITETIVDGERHGSVSNVGTRPTVGGHALRLETHIFDFDGDLYGREPEVRFIRFIRPEMTFESEEALCRAISDDVAAAEKYFAERESEERG